MADKRAKIGRPRKAEGEQRTEWLPRLRVTPAEREHVAERAARAGLTLPEFCRRAVMGQRVTPSRSALDDAAIVALNRAGVNLNQIARSLNSGRGLPDDVAAVMEEVRAAIARIAADGS